MSNVSLSPDNKYFFLVGEQGYLKKFDAEIFIIQFLLYKFAIILLFLE